MKEKVKLNSFFILLIIISSVTTAVAQDDELTSKGFASNDFMSWTIPVSPDANYQISENAKDVGLTRGDIVHMRLSFEVGDVVTGDPEIVDVVMSRENTIFINAKATGSTNLIVFDVDHIARVGTRFRVNQDVEGIIVPGMLPPGLVGVGVCRGTDCRTEYVSP